MAVSGSIRLYWALLGSIGLLLGSIGLYWALLGLPRPWHPWHPLGTPGHPGYTPWAPILHEHRTYMPPRVDARRSPCLVQAVRMSV